MDGESDRTEPRAPFVPRSVQHPKKNLVVFLAQVVVCLTVIVAAIVNLSLSNDNKTLWTSLLSATTGYLLPNPSLKQPWPAQGRLRASI